MVDIVNERIHTKLMRQHKKLSIGDVEAQQQRAFVAWARSRGLTLWHTPNQLAARSAQHGANNKALGVTAGVADIVVANVLPARPAARGLALEFKVPGKYATAVQRVWLASMVRNGWAVYVVHSCDIAVRVCLDLGL